VSVTILKLNGRTNNNIPPSKQAEVYNVADHYFGRSRSDPDSIENHFRLDHDFLVEFIGKKPNFGFNGLGEFVFYRTYSRIKEDGTKETFVDVLKRVVEGCYEIQRRWCRSMHIPWTESKAQLSAQEMFRRMWDFKFLPPGRGLWMMGTPFMWERGSASLNNCAFVSTSDLSEADPAEPFCFMMDMAMLGVGVGFDTKGAGKILVHQPDATRVRTFQIPDSREGWVDSVRHLIRSYTIAAMDGIVEFDYSLIRQAGMPIKGFGGKASGPAILMELHTLIRAHLHARIDQTLDAMDITDLMNYIGRCVVAGNVRRCLPKGTLIHLKRGLVPIEQVQVGDLVLTQDGYHPITENVYQGTQRVVTIKNQMGQFRCTDRHRIAVMTSFGRYDWKRANQLVPGDRMVFVNEMIDGTDTILPAYNDPSTRGHKLVIPSLTTEVAWFIGAIHGDGYVHPGRVYNGRQRHGASLSIAINQDEYYDGISELARRGFAAFNCDPKIQPSQDNCIKLRVVSRQLATYFYRYFKQAKTPLGVPECIRLGLPRIRAAYLAGLLDTDGSTKNRPTTLVVSVYYDFLRQVQAVYASLGIPTKLRLRKKQDDAGQAKWDLSLVGDFAVEKFKELVQPYAIKQRRVTVGHSNYDFGYPGEWVIREGLRFNRKWTTQQDQMTQTRAVACGAPVSNMVPVAVLEVVDEGIEAETYDLSVSERSEFVAQGLLVHNTAQVAFGDADDDTYCSMKNPTRTLQPCDLDVWFKITGGLYQQKRSFASAQDFVGAGIPDERLLPAIKTWNALNHHRWASNNSIFAYVGMNYADVGKQISVNGEPGVIWLNNVRDYGRMIDGFRPGIDGRVMGANPCLTGGMRLLTAQGYQTIYDLWMAAGCQDFDGYPTIEKYGQLTIINRNGHVPATNVYRTAEEEDVYRVHLSNGQHIDATATHRFIALDENGAEHRLCLSDLMVGLRLPLTQAGSVEVIKIEYVGKEPTYCLTEPGNHEITINGVAIGNCLEQSLESYELCCLVESFPANHESAEDYMRTLKFAYLYAKTVTLLPTHNSRTNQVMLRNRRIGLSQSGIVQAFAKFSRRVVLKDFCDAGYNEVRRWDDIYSSWLCIPKSIKVTSVKPSGTISLVVGATPGIHYPEASTYWRTVRVAKDSVLVKILREAGYRIEPAISDKERTVVVYFAISDPSVRPVGEVSMWEQMHNTADYQRYWADNQVSCTIKFKPHEAPDIPRGLEAYEDQLKGISFLPYEDHGFPQAPYIPCSPETVAEYNSGLGTTDYTEYINEAVGAHFCDSDKCMLPAH
jgi:intein/homing endonuclease